MDNYETHGDYETTPTEQATIGAATTEDFIIYRDGKPVKVYYAPGADYATAQPATDPLDLVTTASEITALYGITVGAVNQAIQRGAIPCRKAGAFWLIMRADAEAMWGGLAAKREMKERARGGG